MDLFSGSFRPTADQPYLELPLALPAGTKDLKLALELDLESYSGDKGHPVLWVFGGKWKRTIGYLTLRENGVARLRTIWDEIENKDDARARLSGPIRCDFTAANGKATLSIRHGEPLQTLQLSTPIGAGEGGALPTPLTIWLGSDDGHGENRPEGFVFKRLRMAGAEEPGPEPDRVERAVALLEQALALLKQGA
ncbi:MAG TPA: hypothetical protein VGG06_17220 [Thermoanaerobaculia bacterium]|jgi:hypothetical protein